MASKCDDGSDMQDTGKAEIKDDSQPFGLKVILSEMGEERNMLRWENYELHLRH